MADPRRVGNAMRRRMGAPSSMYADAAQPPEFSPGDMVTAKGRRGPMRVSGIVANVPENTYAVQGGYRRRFTTHQASDLSLIDVVPERNAAVNEWLRLHGRRKREPLEVVERYQGQDS